MPEPDLILPGFFGKLPEAGDFVTRGLPAGFVHFWDRWCARHLAAVPAGRWPAGGLRFALPGTATGLTLPSHDRSGRNFPLTVAAPAPKQPESWYDRIAALAAEAAAGRIGPDLLEARLHDAPALPGAAAPTTRPLLWRVDGRPRNVDLSAPVLAGLFPGVDDATCGR